MDLLDLFVKIGVKDEASEAVEGVSQNIIGKLGKAAATAAKALAGAFAVKKVVDFGKAAFDAYGQFEQLAGGAKSIFDEVDQSKILNDANGAWKNLNMSANEYLAAINQTGAMFAQTMGDEAGYETAKQGMQAISDYASGTGRDINELNDKFSMITRSTSSYQSIADQFAGILPATSKDFLAQAQAADLLSDSYTSLTDVPVAEYQQAVSGMLEKGVADLGLAGNTAKESLNTITGSVAATKSAWQNLVTEFGKPDADIGARVSDLVDGIFGIVDEKTGQREGGLFKNVTTEVGVIATNMVSAVGQGVQAGFDWLMQNGPTLVDNALGSIQQAMQGAIDGLSGILAGNNPFESLFNDASGIVEKVSGFVSGIGAAIQERWPEIVATAGTLWDQFANVVTTYGPTILSKIGSVLGNIGNTILEHWPEIQGAAAEAWLSLVEWVTSNGPTLVSKAAEIIGNVVETAKNWLVANGPAIFEAASAAFGNVATAIVEHGPEILSNIGETIGLAIGYVADAAPRLLSAAVEFMTGLITGTSEQGQVLHQWFADFFPDGLLSGLGDFTMFLLDAGKSLIDGLLNGIGKAAPNVEKAIRGAFDSVIGFFSGIADFIADPMGSIEGFVASLTGTSETAAASVDGAMASVATSTANAAADIASYNAVGLDSKYATATVSGNAQDGSGGKSVQKYNGIKLADKKATATVTGNAQDGKAKTSIDNTNKAVKNLSGKSISVSASGNVISGVAESAIRGVKSLISNLQSKSVTLTTYKKEVKTGGAWGGITPRYHATGGVRVADRWGEGVPLDVVGERGPEAIVPLSSRYGKDFARMMGQEASKYMGGPTYILQIGDIQYNTDKAMDEAIDHWFSVAARKAGQYGIAK